MIDPFLEDELVQMDDDPEPETNKESKAKDDLNVFSDSESESEDETELNDAGKELKAIMKKENGEDGSSNDEDEDDEEDDDIDNDEKYSKSALFMQGILDFDFDFYKDSTKIVFSVRRMFSC